MCYWPKEDPKYDPNKSRAENYQILRKLFEDEAKNVDRSRTTGGSSSDLAKRMLEKRIFKGAHLDWNYTEMLRDLIEQGLVKVPITEFDVAFVEWASGSLDEVENSFYKGEKALFDWENKKWPGYDKIGRWGNPEWFNKRNDLAEAHIYNDSNREEYIPTPVMNVEQIPQQIEYGNHEAPNFIPWQEREHTAFWVTGVAE